MFVPIGTQGPTPAQQNYLVGKGCKVQWNGLGVVTCLFPAGTVQHPAVVSSESTRADVSNVRYRYSHTNAKNQLTWLGDAVFALKGPNLRIVWIGPPDDERLGPTDDDEAKAVMKESTTIDGSRLTPETKEPAAAQRREPVPKVGREEALPLDEWYSETREQEPDL